MSTCCIFGLGYIGLPTAAVLSKAGHQVIGVDVNSQVVATVNEGRIHIVEPDLDQVVAESVASGSLTAQLTPAPADVFLIAVPTPFRSGPTASPSPTSTMCLPQPAPLCRCCALAISCCWNPLLRWVLLSRLPR